MEPFINYTCSIGNEHLLRKSKYLPCGFLVCVDCLNGLEYNNFICPCCTDRHKITLIDELKSNEEIDKQIEENFQGLTVQLIEKLESKINNKNPTTENEIVENYFEYMKDQVLLQTESAKIELDKICDKICEKINKCKENKTRELDRVNAPLNEIIEKANDFIKSFQEKVDKTVEDMYVCGRYVDGLREKKTNAHDLVKNISFTPSDIKLQYDIIGSFKNIEGLEKITKEPENTNFDEMVADLKEDIRSRYSVEIDTNFDFNGSLKIGRVVFVKYDYGFIKPGDEEKDEKKKNGTGDVYFRQRQVIGNKRANINDVVIFNETEGSIGMEAVNIKRLTDLHNLTYRDELF